MHELLGQHALADTGLVAIEESGEFCICVI